MSGSVEPDTAFLNPVGPVAGAFGISEAFLAWIMGPVGGGKTTECIARGVRVGLMQKAVWDPKRKQMVKRCRGAVVRDTYPNLDRTVIKSWHQWFPKDLGRWTGDAPRMHAFTLEIGKRGSAGFHLLDMEVIFTAIGDRSVEDVLRGLELTWLWLNEADLLPRSLVEIGVGRVGRYPSAKDGGCEFAQIFGDFNAPEEDNWLYELCVEKEIPADLVEAIKLEFGETRPLLAYFRQPGGLDEGAENLHNLPPKVPGNPKAGRAYYLKQAALMSHDKKRRFIDNRFGAVRKGMPVFPEFRDEVHVREFDFDPKLPILIGADQGLLAAATLHQLDPMRDQLRQFDEMARIFESEDGSIEVSQIGGEAFGRELRQRIQTRWPGGRIGLVVCDPAGAAGEDAIQHRSWRKDFENGLGVPVRKARVPGNAIDLRLKPVRKRLEGMTNGNPKFLLHPRCKVTRKAFNSRYAWARVQAGSDIDGGRFADKPVKIQGYSDVMDADQYLMFELEKGIELDATGPASRGRGRREVKVDHDYPMFGSR